VPQTTAAQPAACACARPACVRACGGGGGAGHGCVRACGGGGAGHGCVRAGGGSGAGALGAGAGVGWSEGEDKG